MPCRASWPFVAVTRGGARKVPPRAVAAYYHRVVSATAFLISLAALLGAGAAWAIHLGFAAMLGIDVRFLLALTPRPRRGSTVRAAAKLAPS